MGVSENRSTPKSSILRGFSIINHPFWGTPIFGNTRIYEKRLHSPIIAGGWLTIDYSFCTLQNISNKSTPTQKKDPLHWPLNRWNHRNQLIVHQRLPSCWEARKSLMLRRPRHEVFDEHAQRRQWPSWGLPTPLHPWKKSRDSQVAVSSLGEVPVSVNILSKNVVKGNVFFSVTVTT